MIAEVTRLWRVWLWKDPDVEQRALDAGCISLGRDDVGELTDDITDDEIDRRLRRVRPTEKDGAYREFVRYWRRFLEMSPGDYVLVALSGNRVTAARVVGPLEQHPEAEWPELRYVRRVELLLDDPRHKSTLPRELEKRRDLPPTVLPVDYPGAIREFTEWLESDRERR